MCVDLEGMQHAPFSCNGIWEKPEFDETCRQQNFIGLCNFYYCKEFNCFALTYARVVYGLGKGFQGSAKGGPATALKKVGRRGMRTKGKCQGETLLK